MAGWCHVELPNFPDEDDGGEISVIDLFKNRFDDRLSESFQNYVIDDYVNNFCDYAKAVIDAKQHHEDLAFIQERSLFCNMRVFVKKMLDDKQCGDVQARLLLKKGDRFFQTINRQFNLVPIFIYLYDDVEHIFDRLKRRNRPGEEMVSMEYLQDLNQRYEKIFHGDHFPFSVVKIYLGDYLLENSTYREIDVKAIAAHIKSIL